MKPSRGLPWTLAFTSLLSQPCNAQEIDLGAEVKRMAFARDGFLPLRDKGNVHKCMPNGDITDIHPLVNALVYCGYRFDNIRSVAVSVNYSDVKPAAVPISSVKEVWQYANCDSKPVVISDNISVATTEGATITTSTSVTYSSSSSTTANITVPVKAISIGLSNTESVNFTKNQSDSNVINRQETRSTTQAINITVPPKTVHVTTLERTISNAYIDFDGVVVLNADIILEPRRRKDNSILEGGRSLGALVDYAPDEAARTIHLKGQIWSAKGLNTNRTDIEKPINVDSPPCAYQNEITEEINANLSQSMGNKVGNVPYRYGFIGLFNGGVQVTEPLVSGMLVKTSNSVANVEVRSKSLGPGFCAVNISSSLGSSAFLAPPFSWSPWTNLFSHVGAVGTTVTTSVGCDTGALFEVRYFK